MFIDSKNKKAPKKRLNSMSGVAGFEPMTNWLPKIEGFCYHSFKFN